MRGNHPIFRTAAACVLLAACSAPVFRRSSPPPLPRVEVPPPAVQASAPRPLAMRPAPDPATGLPPGWYVPEPPAAPEPETGAAVPLTPAESEPRRTSPELRTRALLRDFPWISGFWSELAPAERARAERAFARRGVRVALAERWDGMGLGERVLLLFGPGRG